MSSSNLFQPLIVEFKSKTHGGKNVYDILKHAMCRLGTRYMILYRAPGIDLVAVAGTHVTLISAQLALQNMDKKYAAEIIDIHDY